MGWTHYWKRESTLPAEAFEKASKDCKVILTGIDVPLAGPEAEGEPFFSQDKILFNGVNGRSCEPFSIEAVESPRIQGRPVFSFCKTEHLPYDLCVKCALVILKHYLGDQIKVMSDRPDDDWQDARHLCLQHLGYGDDFSLCKDS